MIDDEELRTLFQAESDEHLRSLEDGLLRLETDPRDAAILEAVFRAAHSLKGAARMLGVAGVEQIAHQAEDTLGAARHGHAVLSPEMIDRLCRGLDAMRGLVQEAVTGAPAGIDVPRVLRQVRGEEGPDAPERAPPPTAPESPEEPAASEPPASHLPLVEEPAGEPEPVGPEVAAAAEEAPDSAAAVPEAPEAAVSPPAAAPAALIRPEPAVLAPDGAAGDEAALQVPVPPVGQATAVPAAGFTIETIRVEPQRLDSLMTLAGELTVTTTRAARGLAALDDIEALREEWLRDAAALRSLRLAAGADGGERAGRLLERFQEREQGRLERLGRTLERLRRTTGQDVTRVAAVAEELQDQIQGMRLLPLSTLFNLFPRMVRDLARELGKEVRLVVEGSETTADKKLIEDLKDPLMHMLRNAVDHGIELPDDRERRGKPRSATLRLRAYRTAAQVVIEIADDGRGLDTEAIRRTALQRRVLPAEELLALPDAEVRELIFAPGFSTSAIVTDVSGRGVGLDVVRANVQRLKGSLQVESVSGKGCAFRILAPLTLATTRVLLVRVARWNYALPVEFVTGMALVPPGEVFSLEGRSTLRFEDRPLPVAYLSDLLELPAHATDEGGKGKDERAPAGSALAPASAAPRLPLVRLRAGTEPFALFVDALLDEQEVVLKPPGALLRRVRNVSGATILATGEICMVLNPHDLVKSLRRRLRAAPIQVREVVEERKKVVLLAEDSITTRTQEKRILEGAGYEVVTAVDGADALAKLATREFDAIVSDIQMPQMDGLALCECIRREPRYRDLPIILVTSLASDEDRKRGVDVGADAYITKGAFDQAVLIDTLKRLA